MKKCRVLEKCPAFVNCVREHIADYNYVIFPALRAYR